MFFKNVKIITFKGEQYFPSGSQTPYTKMESAYPNNKYNVQRNDPTVPPPSYNSAVDPPPTRQQTGKFFVSKDFN